MEHHDTLRQRLGRDAACRDGGARAGSMRSQYLLVAVLTAAAVVQDLDAKRYARLSYVAFSAAQESARMKDRYGPSRYSRNEEEWIFRDYFQDKRGRSFVDVGANHYKNECNTFTLNRSSNGRAWPSIPMLRSPPTAASSGLGGHPKPAISGHLKTGHFA